MPIPLTNWLNWTCRKSFKRITGGKGKGALRMRSFLSVFEELELSSAPKGFAVIQGYIAEIRLVAFAEDKGYTLICLDYFIIRLS
jgi:hypothetical protein